METKAKTPVTMFLMTEFGLGVRKLEAWLVEHGRRPWAQYPDAPYAVFIPKGKRKPRKWQGSYQPYCVILKGHGHELDPGSPWVPAEAMTPGVTAQRGRYSCFDPRWATDFNAKLDAYCRPEIVVADYRK